jgi:prepilin-type N-terminal cleavage/methylation domain-containing protein
MTKINSDSGFTLLEVMISILILGIISISIIPIIGSSAANVIKVGRQDLAVNTAANFTDIIQQKVIADNELSEEEWKAFRSKEIYYNDKQIKIEYIDCGSIESISNEEKLLFCKTDIKNGYRLKVVFYYDNGNKKTELNSFVSYKRR